MAFLPQRPLNRRGNVRRFLLQFAEERNMFAMLANFALLSGLEAVS